MNPLPPKPKSKLLTRIVGGAAITATLLTGCTESTTPGADGGVELDAGLDGRTVERDAGDDAEIRDAGTDFGPSVGFG